MQITKKKELTLAHFAQFFADQCAGTDKNEDCRGAFVILHSPERSQCSNLTIAKIDSDT